jgi:hypothetical protein
VLACAAAAMDAPVAVTAVLGIVLFVAPGYLLDQLLFGSRLAGLERVVVAVGLAFCVPVLGGLILYAAGVPLHRTGWLALLAGATLAADLGVFVRRFLGRSSRATVPETRSLIKWPRSWRLPRSSAVAFGAALVIAGGAVALASVGAAKQHYAGFTQLWLVRKDPDARTANIGVANYEGRTISYKLVLFHNSSVAATWNLNLPSGRAWQRATQSSDRYTITAKLYRLPDVSRAYRYVVLDGDRTPGS